MPKRKTGVIATPAESTLALLEPVRGISDVRDERIVEAARQLLALPQAEQIAAVQWMGTQPEYAGILSYLVAKAGVTGALRRAVKQAIFELRRRGAQVTLVQQEEPLQESPAVSQAWMVDDVFAASPYRHQNYLSAVHMRFFMHHTSGQRAVFMLNISPDGYLHSARLVDEEVNELYRECVDYPYLPDRIMANSSKLHAFARVPVEWAVQVAHEVRQRNIADHIQMPAHAAFYWGRLPAPPPPPVAYPIDSIPDVETGWLVTSLLDVEPSFPLPMRVIHMLLPYMPHPERFAAELHSIMNESESRIVLTPQAEEERNKQRAEKLRERLFPDEEAREILVFMLPILGSIAMAGGDRNSAAWLKALWRELKERPDRPLWRTATADILVSASYQLLLTSLGVESSEEAPQDEPPALQT